MTDPSQQTVFCHTFRQLLLHFILSTAMNEHRYSSRYGLEIPTSFSFFSSSLSNLKANTSSRQGQRNCAFGKRIVSGFNSGCRERR
jgi:hypothetical protein